MTESIILKTERSSLRDRLKRFETVRQLDLDIDQIQIGFRSKKPRFQPKKDGSGAFASLCLSVVSKSNVFRFNAQYL